MEAEKKTSIVSLMVLVVCPVLLILMNTVYALPIVNNVTVSPKNPWTGWDVRIAAECTDPGAGIERVYANISGPAMIFSNMELINTAGSKYSLDLHGSDLTETGLYDVSIGCINDAGEQRTGSDSFSISRLTGEITSVVDILGYEEEGSIYTEEQFDAYFLVKKDDTAISIGIDFTVILNNEEITIQEPIPFIYGKGHRLSMTGPEDEGNNIMEIKAVYNGEEVSDVIGVEVKELMVLELISIDKTSISSLETITMKMKATERGSPLPIKEGDIKITINSADVTIDNIKQEGDAYKIEFTPPNLSPGSYTLEIVYEHDGKNKTIDRAFTFAIPVEGEISYNGKGVSAKIIFDDRNGLVTSLTTDGNGLYSGSMLPGTYDITLEHSDSRITFYGVNVDEFDDPLRYNNLGDSKAIPGIYNAGLYVYETALSYSRAKIEMEYNEKKVEGPESQLSVYKCSDWNGDECFSEWEDVDADIDTVRNTAEVEINSLSAFVVGTREGISAEIGLDKDEYILFEKLRLDGLATFGDNAKLSDALITAKVLGTSKSKTVSSNDEGIFSVEFTVPDKTGEHTIEVKLEKEPFTPVILKKTFNVVKSTGISISIPTGVKMNVMDNETIEFSVKNTGQQELSEVDIHLEDVTENNILASIDTEGVTELKSQEEVSLFIEFRSLKNVTKSYTMKVVVNSKEGVFAEKSFALTTERRDTSIGTGSPGSGNGGTSDTSPVPIVDFSLVGNVITSISGSVGYLVAILVGSLSFALIMRKKRLSRVVEREWIKHKLSSVRLEIGKPEGASKDELNKNTNTNRFGNMPEQSLSGQRAPSQLEDLMSSMHEQSTRKRKSRNIKKKLQSKPKKKQKYATSPPIKAIKKHKSKKPKIIKKKR